MNPTASLSRWDLRQEEARLGELHRWLTREGAAGLLGTSAFVVPYQYVFGVLAVAAVAFTPYLLWRLYQARRYGWIVGFVVVVGLPVVVFSGAGMVGGFLQVVLPLLSFYLYTWALRHAVGEWLEALRWQRHDLERSR